jgi:hypothetical protein
MNEAPMRSDSDLVVIATSRAGRQGLFGLFLVSLVMDADTLLLPTLTRFGWVQPNAWTHGTHTLVGMIEILVVIGATILWLLMLLVCMFDPRRSMGLKVIWGLVFLFTTWYGAQFFYLFPYRQSMKRPE